MHCSRDIHRRTLIGESKMMYFMGFLQAEIVLQGCGGNLQQYPTGIICFSQQKSSFLASQFHFWAVSMSKVFGMHTTLYWLRGMHCWWRLTVNIVRRDETLMNLSKCREQTDWKKLTGTGLQWVADYLSVGSKWMTGICLWMHVVDCVKGYYPFGTQIMPCLFERHGMFVDSSKHPCLYGR